jgi:GNAT superfamily N-acetyltransferase
MVLFAHRWIIRADPGQKQAENGRRFMNTPLSVCLELARQLPDLPCWVETRAMLLSGRCLVVRSAAGEGDYLVCGTDRPLIGVVGRPEPAAIRQAVEQASEAVELLARPDVAEHVAAALPEWEPVLAILHLLPTSAPPLPRDADDVRLLRPEESHLLEPIEGALPDELREVLPWAPLAAAFADGLPVSFCHAYTQTETLWDVSIDTVPAYRRRGLAAKCAAFLIRHMRSLGKEPVWGAVETNEASRGLAAKFGFVPVDRLTVFLPRRHVPRWMGGENPACVRTRHSRE